MNPIKLSNSMAKGLLKMAAKKDARKYLNGILIDMSSCVAVACDGVLLGICRPAYIDNAGGGFIIPRSALESAAKLKGDIFIHESAGKYRLIVGQVVILFEPEDWSFLDWRKALPTKTSGETGQYNPQHLARAHDFLNLCANKKETVPYLHHNGTSAALMTVAGSDAVAAIMPWRSNLSDSDFLDSLIAPVAA